MRKLLVALFIFSVVAGCKKTDEGTVDQSAKVDLTFDYQKLPTRATINLKATEILDGWEEFKAFDASFDVLYKATNTEDLALAVDDLIEKEKKLNEGNYPELFDTFQIKSRQRVIRTYLYMVKASILENQPTTEPSVDMIKAYNAMRKQFNTIVNSQLDKKLILDEN
ncbi:hypothetical protein [Allomuricauda sp. M10]|uniref:hypothetical protein n=1 Tax=Allomuricauda sp. M10 TaxID=2683292 RepID=UPI001D196264|nr:hypothetical protein [Muricauda sp. M10]